MTNTQLKGKDIGIFGLGKTGHSVYDHLKNLANSIVCYDDNEIHRKGFAEDCIIPLNDQKWQELDLIVVSPGIPHSHQIFALAKAYNIKITSDIELFIQGNPDSEYIFITGTNGKSTVTAIVGHILQSSGVDCEYGGNIGKPALSLPRNKNFYVLELSSFQIELLSSAAISHAKISVITNITPDHLDRHGTIEKYSQIKTRVLTDNSIKIIGTNSTISKALYRSLVAKGITQKPIIEINQQNTANIAFQDNVIIDNFFDCQSHALPELTNLSGKHNQENLAIAYAAARALGIPAKEIIASLTSFKGLPYRTEYLGTWKYIKFYNDSKATNIASAIASLSSFSNIIWFAGGKFKEESLEELKPFLGRIAKAYFFGESKQLFADFFQEMQSIYPELAYEVHENLPKAFTAAADFSSTLTKPLTFLLAPACASYDQFKNFEERGKCFTDLVKKVYKI